MKTKPELLAPVGSEDALRAAVQNGADAVYLGTGAFDARQSADKFTGDKLADAVRYCHLRGVKVYATLNTIVREAEMPAFEPSVLDVVRADVDAVLVQDFGVVSTIRQIAPRLALHASTQMAVHNRAGVEFMRKQGFARVVLAREMSLKDIRACAGLGIELEVFVHGALCVSGSGQCLFSAMIGGRSANRGRCAQPCRLNYALNGAEGCLLSCRDLCAADLLNPLAEAGVDSFKLEGRLKRPEYVAVVTAAYRQAIDHPELPVDIRALAQMFNRGQFTHGYLTGVEESKLIFAERPNHMGVSAGSCDRDGRVRLSEKVEQVDTLVLRRVGREDVPVRLSGSAGETVPCRDAGRGDQLIRLVSQAQMRAAQESWRTERRANAVCAEAALRTGRPARLTLRAGEDTVAVEGPVVEAAQNRGADPERIRAQLAKTGGTPWRFEEIRVDADADAFCPASMLNALRRDALEKLETMRLGAPETPRSAAEPRLPAVRTANQTLLAQSRDPAILRSALSHGADEALFEPCDLREGALSAAGALLPERFSLVLPAIAADRTLQTLHAWATGLRERIDCVWINNVGQLNLSWPGTLCADGMLHIANRRAVETLHAWGCARFAPSVELTCAQIEALGVPTVLTVYGRTPLMHLRHCPLRTARGDAGPHSACRMCDSCPTEQTLDRQALRDRTGAAFPLRRQASDDGCVIRLVNSVPTLLLRRIGRLPDRAGLRLIIEPEEDVGALIRLHRMAMRGEDFRQDPDWPRYDEMNTTTGHYFRGVE